MHSLINEITGDNIIRDDRKAWEQCINNAWSWTKSETGNLGMLLEKDYYQVTKLKGSDKYNRLSREIALLLFIRFATDWTDKRMITPKGELDYKRRKTKKRQQKRPPKHRPPVSDRRGKRLLKEQLKIWDKEWLEESKYEDDESFLQRMLSKDSENRSEWTIEDEDTDDDIAFIVRLQQEQDLFENFDLDRFNMEDLSRNGHSGSDDENGHSDSDEESVAMDCRE